MHLAGMMIALAFSFYAQAEPVVAGKCPDLVGKYECKTLDQTRSLNIGQWKSGEIDVYNIENFQIITDGSQIPTGNDRHFRNGTITATCDGTHLIMILDADYYPQGQFSGRMQVTMTRGRTDDGSLYVRNAGFLNLGEKSLALSGEGSCKFTGR